MKFPFALGHTLRFFLGLGLVFTSALRAQDSDLNAPLNQQQLEQLMGPIALYPDALVALILPASTEPADVVLAARYLANGGDSDQIDYQPWNDSIKALAHYPALVKWMDENLQWTRQLGSVFLNQPGDVMDAVQRLRTRARANGTLTSTAQQKLLLDGGDIEIVPAQPDVIYVPYYDPNLVYGQPGYYGGPPYLTFGEGLPVGFWLTYDFNWRRHTILVGDRHHNWQEHHDWNRQPPSGGPNNGNWHAWQPPVNRPPFARPESRPPQREIVTPKPLPGAPSYPRDQHPREPDWPRPDTNGRETDRNRLPLPVNPPSAKQDSRDDRDNRDKRPAPAPEPPRPEVTAPAANPPRPSIPESHNPPVPLKPDSQAFNPSNRQPPTRPEVRPVNPPPPRQANPPPPPASKDQEPPK